MKDILFRNYDFIFSYRASAILRQGDTVLLQCADGEYATIGGHVAAMETAEDTLKREFREELHAHIAVDGLLCVGENFFPWGQVPCHQICLFYRAHLTREGQIPTEGFVPGYDDAGNPRKDVTYRWVPLEEIKNGLTVYPKELIPCLLGEEGQTGHFVSWQL